MSHLQSVLNHRVSLGGGDGTSEEIESPRFLANLAATDLVAYVRGEACVCGGRISQVMGIRSRLERDGDLDIDARMSTSTTRPRLARTSALQLATLT